MFRCIAEAFERNDIRSAHGSGLWSVLREAGLRPQGMIGVQPCLAPDDPDGPALLTESVRTVLPLMERSGVATAAELDLATLQQTPGVRTRGSPGGIPLSHTLRGFVHCRWWVLTELRQPASDAMAQTPCQPAPSSRISAARMGAVLRSGTVAKRSGRGAPAWRRSSPQQSLSANQGPLGPLIRTKQPRDRSLRGEDLPGSQVPLGSRYNLHWTGSPVHPAIIRTFAVSNMTLHCSMQQRKGVPKVRSHIGSCLAPRQTICFGLLSGRYGKASCVCGRQCGS
jgi:hypothetical protein